MAKTQAKEVEADSEDKDGKKTAEGAEGANATPPKSKKKLIIIVVAALLVVVGGAAAFFMSGSSKHEDKAAAGELGPDGKPIDKPIFFTLPEFLVNLNTSGKQTSFLKSTVILELAHQSDSGNVDANLPRLLDALNTYLRELHPSDLSGSAGIQRLREELLLRANKTLSPVKVNDVLFKEIIVQ